MLPCRSLYCFSASLAISSRAFSNALSSSASSSTSFAFRASEEERAWLRQRSRPSGEEPGKFDGRLGELDGLCCAYAPGVYCGPKGEEAKVPGRYARDPKELGDPSGGPKRAMALPKEPNGEL